MLDSGGYAKVSSKRFLLRDACSGPQRVAAAGRQPILTARQTMKDVKVDVRVNVDVDAASVVLLFASAAMALFLYRQNKQERLK
jgi:hypothetical protein